MRSFLEGTRVGPVAVDGCVVGPLRRVVFGAEGNPGPIERVIRRSEDSNADPRTDEVARTGVVHVPAVRQGGCNTPHGVLGGLPSLMKRVLR